MMRFFSNIFVALFFILLFCGGSAFAADAALGKLNWNTWRTIPVYDDGRAMPLNTFSRLAVARICGTNRPYLILDAALLEKAESLLAAKYGADAENCEKEAAHIRKRLQELFPHGERRFEAHELLFSWLVEPGVWDFVPLIHVKKGKEFRSDIIITSQMGKSDRQIAYIASIQLDTSVGYNDLLDRVRERQHEAMLKARREGESQGTPKVEMSTLEATALELHNTLDEFRDLTFIAKKSSAKSNSAKSDTKIVEMDYIDVDQAAIPFAASNTVQNASPAFVHAMKNVQLSFTSVSRNWSRIDSQGLIQLLPKNPTNTETANEKTRPVSMFEKVRAVALLFTHLNRMIEEENANSFSLERAESLLEATLILTDQILNESETILDALYPEKRQLAENKDISKTQRDPQLDPQLDPQRIAAREEALAFHFSLVLLRRSTQTAYLSLYQSGRTLQVLPALSDEAVRSDHSSGTDLFEFTSQSPWVPLNLVLHGGPAAVRRFVDRNYPLPVNGPYLEDFFPPELRSSLSDPIRKILQKPAEFQQFKKKETAKKNDGKKTTDQSGQSGESDQIPNESAKDVVNRTLDDFEHEIDVQQKLATNSITSIRRAYLDSVLAYTGVEIKTERSVAKKTLSDTESQSDVVPSDTTTAQSAEKENSAEEEVSTEEEPFQNIFERSKGPRNMEWNGSIIVFAHSLRETAEQMEPIRETLLPEEMSDSEILRKTAYPAKNSLNAEFFYTRLDPFYWMGLTALISLICLVLSALLGFVRRILVPRETKIVVKPNQEQKEPGTQLVLQSYPYSQSQSQSQSNPQSHSAQNSAESKSKSKSSKKPSKKYGKKSGEKSGKKSQSKSGAGIDLFPDPYEQREAQERFPRLRRCEAGLFWSGVAFLTISAAIIFLGCALRSYISGWAPVSNMFETIVLMSFFAACLGLWFSLQPLFGPSLLRSWRFTEFPWTFFKKAYKNIRSGEIDEFLKPEMSDNEQSDALKERYYRSSSSIAHDTGFHDTTTYDLKTGTGTYANYDDFGGIPDEISAAQRQPSKFASDFSSDNFIYLSVAFVRVLLIVLTLGVALVASYHETADGQGLFRAIIHSFAMNDPIDWIVVLCTFGAIVWFVPRFLLTGLLFPFVFMFSGENAADFNFRENPDTDSVPVSIWDKILNRKVFVLVGALIVCFAAIATQMNPKEFNPNIRPLAAVLRSNFWLAVHVIAIVISYASGLIAWLLALTSLGAYTFGVYRKDEINGKPQILPPYFCETIGPYIRETLKAAAWMLMIGTILGARWADYSWGRFWSWDVKEVWALITLLVILGVLHGRIARYYGEFGVAIGAILSAIAIVMTWYGFNFVFKVGRHAYGYGDSSWATIFMLGFILVNFAWGFLAVLRFTFEHSGSKPSSI